MTNGNKPDGVGSTNLDETGAADDVKSANRGHKDKDNADAELIDLWASEATQAHQFRQWAFWGGFGASCLLFFLWLIVMLFFWPEHWYTTSMTLAYSLKLSLCTLTFLTIAIATLRFAIRCYGHHQNGSTTKDYIGTNLSEPLKQVVELAKLLINQKQ